MVTTTVTSLLTVFKRILQFDYKNSGLKLVFGMFSRGSIVSRRGGRGVLLVDNRFLFGFFDN